MKEYLTKNNHGNYELVYQKWRNDDIEIPDGANYAYNNDLGLLFMPSEIGFNHPLLAWKREQDEPFFTPECTLNDQYAEIEQVRQNQKTTDAMREAEGILSGKKLKGMKYDNDKPRHSLLPKGTVNAVINVLEFGAKKYEADNWKKVDNAKERYYNAAMRHIDRWWNGEKRDPETNIHHLAHAATSLFFLIWFDENGEQ